MLIVFLALGDLNWRALAQLEPFTLLLAFTLLGLNYLIGGLRLTALSGLVHPRISLWRGVSAYIMGLISAAVTPGGSGNTPAVALSLQQGGVPTPEAWSLALYLAVLDLFFMAWSLPLSLGILAQTTQLLSARAAAGLSVAAAFSCLGLWFVLSYRLDLLEQLIRRLFALRFLERWQSRALAFHAELGRTTALMARRPLWVQLPLAALTTLQHSTNYLIFFVIASALGEVPLWSTLAAVHSSTFASYAAPVPGGSGFLEVAVTYLLRGNRAVAVPALVAWRLICFYSRFLLAPFVGGALLASYRTSNSGQDVHSKKPL